MNMGSQPLLSCFEIVRDVITSHVEIIARQQDISKEDAYQLVVLHLMNNATEWRSGRQPNIPYRDPLCRIAYLYGITPANANLIEFVFEQEAPLENYLDTIQAQNGCVRVCAFGGGPGTELLGLVKRTLKRNISTPLDLDFMLLDLVAEWGDSWMGMKQQLEDRIRSIYGKRKRDWPVTFSGNFIPIDVANTSDFGNIGAIFGQDLYILSYVVSEIYSNFGNLHDFAAHMVAQAPVGSKWLFIDRREQRWKDETLALAARSGIALGNFHDSTRNMTLDEQRSQLGQLHKDVHRDPRTTWDAFWVVGTKS